MWKIIRAMCAVILKRIIFKLGIKKTNNAREVVDPVSVSVTLALAIINLLCEMFKLINTSVLESLKYKADEAKERAERYKSLAQDIANINKNMRDSFSEDAYLKGLDIEKAKEYNQYKLMIKNILAAGLGVSELSKLSDYGFSYWFNRLPEGLAVGILTSSNPVEDKAATLAAEIIKVEYAGISEVS